MTPKRTTRSTPAITTTTNTPITNTQLKALIDQGVVDTLAACDDDRSMNGDDNHNSGTGSRRTEQTARECTYTDFLKCQPLNFKGVEGFVGLNQWFKRMETVFHISNYTVACQVKFATISLVVRETTRCDRMFPEESDMIEKYVGVLPDLIHRSVMATKPKTMQDAIKFATELIDKKISTFAERQAENKRKSKDTSKNNQSQQEPPKRNKVVRAYTAGSGEKKPYGGSKPLCSKCNYHHDGQCAPKCHKYNRVGHLARDCRSPANANNNNNNNQRAPRANLGVLTCFECGSHGHFKKDYPKLKNNNQGNSAGVGNAVERAYAVGTTGTNPNANFLTGMFLLNNHYALILFDTGANRCFVSSTFSSLIDVVPTALDDGVDVELSDDTAVIVCVEKIVRIPFGNEILIVRGDKSSIDHGSRLNIISCTKTHKYLLKGCHVFLAHVTTKKAEDKSMEKRLEDVPIVQDFPEVFPEDLPGISPARQVEFQIDLIPGVAPVA
ncbi:putative reverse transcriptase domain-containing protein [Tanacetum coccineum]